ncbi:hypothetical protein LLG96_18135 [bacterium]|nr:hypothetical protein [bacterium]
MKNSFSRRVFLKTASVGTALSLRSPSVFADTTDQKNPEYVHSISGKSSVRVCKLYCANPSGLWPKPKLDLQKEMIAYETEFAQLHDELADIDFIESRLITSPDQIAAMSKKLSDADGILVIHLQLGIMPILQEILKAGKPTIVFAVPYSGHEWTQFGALRNQEQGVLMDCLLTGDYKDLAVAVRPFRAIHHLKNARILNVTATEPSADYLNSIKKTFGTDIQTIGRTQVLETYTGIPDSDVETETEALISGAEKVIEPSREEIFKSCKLALAFQKLLKENDATVMTVDCYGSMYHNLPAFPCIGFFRLNNMGLGGICESDLRSTMTFLILQGLVGRPGFVSDPTMDVSRNSIILAHCLGSTKMDGPNGEALSYKIRSIMEREEGAVIQARMRVGQRVTQAILVGADKLQYFTGEIIDTPETDRGCRTKITVRLDGDAEKLWENWSSGLHRVTCYGDLTKDLARFCRFKGITMVNEA